MIVTDTVEINLTSIKKFTKRIIPNDDIELRLIELYRYIVNEDNDPIVSFTSMVLSAIYKDNKLHAYEEITHFYKEKEYILLVNKFISYIEHIILNSIEPDFIDIVFSKYITNSDTIIAEFKISRYTE